MRNLQKPSGMPVHKYRPYHETFRGLPDRTSSKRIAGGAALVRGDLRSGNQALIDPMSPERKRIMFDLLVKMCAKEIEGWASVGLADHLISSGS